MAKLYYTKEIKKIFDDAVNEKLRKLFDDACTDDSWVNFEDAPAEMRELKLVKTFLDELIQRLEEADRLDDEYLDSIREKKEAEDGTAS